MAAPPVSPRMHTPPSRYQDQSQLILGRLLSDWPQESQHRWSPVSVPECGFRSWAEHTSSALLSIVLNGHHAEPWRWSIRKHAGRTCYTLGSKYSDVRSVPSLWGDGVARAVVQNCPSIFMDFFFFSKMVHEALSSTSFTNHSKHTKNVLFPRYSGVYVHSNSSLSRRCSMNCGLLSSFLPTDEVIGVRQSLEMRKFMTIY